MICVDLNAIYIHIPKTAGQSIEAALRELCTNEENFALGENNDPTKGPPILSHLTWNEYIDCGYVTKEEFENFFKFTFVRNPWARLVSEYKYKRYWLKYSFRNWVFKHFPKNSWTDEWRHVMPQYQYICDNTYTPVVDFIGKYENLSSDFSKIKMILNIPDSLDLAHINKSVSVKAQENPLIDLFNRIKFTVRLLQRKDNIYTSYHMYYDKELWDFVGVLYAKDIEIFGYTELLKYEKVQNNLG